MTLENKVDLILEYILLKEKMESLQNRWQYERQEYNYNRENHNNQTPAHLEVHYNDYVKSFEELTKHLIQIEKQLRLNTLDELTKQAQELNLEY